MDQGILFVSADDDHLKAAKECAEQLHAVMPDIPIAICTDASPAPDIFDIAVELPDPRYDWGDLVYAFERTPFKKTVYLDNDIFISEPFFELFELLDHFELAAAHGIGREPYDERKDIPVAFPEPNTGVIAYRSTEQIQTFAEDWKSFYEADLSNGITADQPSFRKAVYENELNFTILPPEYNCRSPNISTLNGHAKIVHGPHDDIKSISDDINDTADPRIHIPIKNDVGVFAPSDASLIDWFHLTAATQGIKSASKKVIKISTLKNALGRVL